MTDADKLTLAIAALYDVIAHCPTCGGSGREVVRAYDAASDSLEHSHTVECIDCKELRRVVEKITS